jgi:hypothetical protein
MSNEPRSYSELEEYADGLAQELQVAQNKLLILQTAFEATMRAAGEIDKEAREALRISKLQDEKRTPENTGVRR